jgi:hypothetical protein
MAAKTKLNLINQTRDHHPLKIAIFQKNIADIKQERPIAWRVIENFTRGTNTSFYYSSDVNLAIKDGWNQPITQSISASYGQSYSVSQDSYGSLLQRRGASRNNQEIEVRNNLRKESIVTEVYKEGKVLAKRAGVSPQKKANFRFRPSIWLGVVPRMKEGEVISVNMLGEFKSEVYLRGVLSADIVLKGDQYSGYQFELENIVFS